MEDTFAKFGKTFQEKVAQLLVEDGVFLEQMSDVLKPQFFELRYLQHLAEKVFEYRARFRSSPSKEVLDVLVGRSDEVNRDSALGVQVREYLARIREEPVGLDREYFEETALEFCRKQSLKEGLVKAIDMMEVGNYDAIQTVIRDSLSKGATRDVGHRYEGGLSLRAERAHRQPIKTPWPALDEVLNGGWERGTLSTFIAPTGAGKSMFLVNCTAAAVENGLNAVYITCEMADFKIGLRHDSYFSGVEINKVSDNLEHVQTELNARARGKLYIKEFPTKTATVQTIRSYLQRLQTAEGITPDIVVLDYADLIRGSKGYGDKRFELEGIYEELRALAQEFRVVLITADQTNRSGLDSEIVSIGQIGEAYAKATVCDLIMTVSRRPEDKMSNTGRLFVAKSRLGQDGMVMPFILNTATVKVRLLRPNQDATATIMDDNSNVQRHAAARFAQLLGNSSQSQEKA